MSNLRLAQDVLTSAWAAGVRELILCAGARNAPFIKLLSEQSTFKTYSFFEERSAGFFALGRMQAEGRPVGIITTSGTAAAELLPACIEADFQRLPLLMITADRPRRYRGSGAPQTITQPGLFSHYVGGQFDIENDWDGDLSILAARRPVHVNISFDEPLLSGEFHAWNLGAGDSPFEPAGARTRSAAAPFIECKRPLVIVGGLTENEAKFVEPILAGWKRPLYLEGTSRLRGHASLREFELRAGEKSIAHLNFDGVIRVGSVPTLRYWRDLENSDLPVHCFSNIPYGGSPRVTMVHALEDLPRQLKFDFWNPVEKQKDEDLAQRREVLFKEYDLSEPAWVEWLSRQLPRDGRLFLGNSLPIREWDFAAFAGATRDVFANRGTNGIDGLVSTFAGAAAEDRSNWALIGDLSLLYDLSGPWALSQRPLKSFNLVVINNGGGQIFNRMFRNPMFLNAHQLRFEHWAKMWSLDYRRLEKPSPVRDGRQVIEIIPDARQTEEFWQAWEVSK